MVLQEDKEFGTALMLGHALTRKYGIGLIQYEAFDDAQFVNVTQANGAVIKDGFFTEDAQDSSLGKYYYRRLNLQISLVDDQLMSLCGKKSETIREELELSKQYCHVAVLVPFYTAVLEKNVFLQFAKQSLPSSSTSSTHRADQMVERIESSVSGDVPKDFRPTTVKNDHTALIVEQQQNLPTLLQQFDASMFKINGIMQGAESWLVRQIQERVDNTFQQKDLNPSLQSLLTQEYLRLILVDIERNFGDGNVNPDQYQKSRANQTSLFTRTSQLMNRLFSFTQALFKQYRQLRGQELHKSSWLYTMVSSLYGIYSYLAFCYSLLTGLLYYQGFILIAPWKNSDGNADGSGTCRCHTINQQFGRLIQMLQLKLSDE